MRLTPVEDVRLTPVEDVMLGMAGLSAEAVRVTWHRR